MIYIVTAIYAEAHAFITRFQLKKEISHTRFQVFLNGETDICLIISGAGSVPAAAAVSSICTEYGAGSSKQGDFLLNAGICAQIQNNGQHASQAALTPNENVRQTGIFCPTENTRPTKNTCPAENARSTENTCPVENARPTENTRPAENARQTENTCPAENTRPAENICLAENARPAENVCQTGKIFLCSKIREQATGKTFYPDILYRHKFAEAQIVTGAKPHEKTEHSGIKETGFYLYDMEAAAIYQAGAYYFGPHQMSFLKIVSDDGNTRNITPLQIERLIDRNMESIAEYIACLQAIAREERQDGIFQQDAAQKKLEKLCTDMHCSKVMSGTVRQYIHYCILSGIDYISVLEDMYRKGKLPCKDKREGKQCFEELKSRLL